MTKPAVKATAHPTPRPAGDQRLWEDQVMERALELWRKNGPAHLDALQAWLQAEREILARNTKPAKSALARKRTYPRPLHESRLNA